MDSESGYEREVREREECVREKVVLELEKLGNTPPPRHTSVDNIHKKDMANEQKWRRSHENRSPNRQYPTLDTQTKPIRKTTQEEEDAALLWKYFGPQESRQEDIQTQSLDRVRENSNRVVAENTRYQDIHAKKALADSLRKIALRGYETLVMKDVERPSEQKPSNNVQVISEAIDRILPDEGTSAGNGRRNSITVVEARDFTKQVSSSHIPTTAATQDTQIAHKDIVPVKRGIWDASEEANAQWKSYARRDKIHSEDARMNGNSPYDIQSHQERFTAWPNLLGDPRQERSSALVDSHRPRPETTRLNNKTDWSRGRRPVMNPGSYNAESWYESGNAPGTVRRSSVALDLDPYMHRNKAVKATSPTLDYGFEAPERLTSSNIHEGQRILQNANLPHWKKIPKHPVPRRAFSRNERFPPYSSGTKSGTPKTQETWYSALDPKKRRLEEQGMISKKAIKHESVV